MTIRPKPRRLRRWGTALLALIVLYLTAVTAVRPTAQATLKELDRHRTLALTLLKSQLMDGGDQGLSAPVALAISQSPLLLSGREQVLALWDSEETEEDTAPEQIPSPSQSSDPIREEATRPGQPLVMADNGVPERTLVPVSPEGYVVWKDVYIDNHTEKSMKAEDLDGTFAASLSEQPGPQVLIVHTHGSEAYTMPAGQEYIPSSDCRTTDCEYNMVRVGAQVKAVLEEAGLTVLHDTRLHDYPQYSGAYDRSLESVETYLEQYPTISLVLDLHRDAVSDGNGTMYKVVSEVAGLRAAQMSFVIGTDGGGLTHPDWLENLKLAAAVQQCLLEDYPTLMRPITVRNSRYNQHTTTGSLLVEMGAAGNSLDEALLSARLLGQALAEVMGKQP